jgi:hypothetical protein
MPWPTNQDLPENSGKPWPPEMEKELIDHLQRRKTLKECAEFFKRTPGGIRSRQLHIARRMVEKGRPIEEVSDLLRVDIIDIEYSISTSKRSKENVEKRRQIKEEHKKNNQIKITDVFMYVKEETPLSLLKEIRDLLKQVVINTNKD